MFGKLLGAIIGLSLGLLSGSGTAGVVLALLGALAGHLHDALHAAPAEPLPFAPPDRPDSSPRDEPSAAPPGRAELIGHLASLFVEVARVDGEISRDEMRVAREFCLTALEFGQEELEQLRQALKAAIATPSEIGAAAAGCADRLGRLQRTLLLHALYEEARVDGELRRSEQDLLRKIACGLGLSEDELRSVTAHHFGRGDGEYRVLGLDPSASDEEVKRTFRRLAAEHHPDRVAGAGPDQLEAASRKFQQIKEAYEEIRRIRGL